MRCHETRAHLILEDGVLFEEFEGRHVARLPRPLVPHLDAGTYLERVGLHAHQPPAGYDTVLVMMVTVAVLWWFGGGGGTSGEDETKRDYYYTRNGKPACFGNFEKRASGYPKIGKQCQEHTTKHATIR